MNFEYPQFIYLEPNCLDCGGPDRDEGRLWCEDDVWSGPCEGCSKNLKSAQYRLVRSSVPHRFRPNPPVEPVRPLAPENETLNEGEVPS